MRIVQEQSVFVFLALYNKRSDVDGDWLIVVRYYPPQTLFLHIVHFSWHWCLNKTPIVQPRIIPDWYLDIWPVFTGTCHSRAVAMFVQMVGREGALEHGWIMWRDFKFRSWFIDNAMVNNWTWMQTFWWIEKKSFVCFKLVLYVSSKYSALEDLEMRDERVKGGFVHWGLIVRFPSQLSLCRRDCTLRASSVLRRYANPEQPQRNSQTHFGLILF